MLTRTSQTFTSPSRERWTIADLEAMPEDGTRYEIIEGELLMSKQPHWHHQVVCGNVFNELQTWSRRSGLGTANLAPGVIFDMESAVAPDVIWISHERLADHLDASGHLTTTPELVVEVLSPGALNEQRDRQAKLKLYSERGVMEYWIVDWQQRQVEIYRREQGRLRLAQTLFEDDELSSPLLPDFQCTVRALITL